MPKTLTKPDEIRRWVEARAGAPMSMDMPDGTGDTRTLLNITFGQHALNADGNEGPDRPTGGYTLVSWNDWFTELKRQNLSLEVPDDAPGVLDSSFEFVSGDEQSET